MASEVVRQPTPWLRFALLSVLLYTISPWLVPFAFWYLVLIQLEQRGVLDRWNATRILGIILMVRTKRGHRMLDRIARPRRFWRAFGEASIWLCVSSMIIVMLLLLLAAIASIIQPPSASLGASDVILIPGVTRFVPLWWPMLALVTALVIHEYGHGLQARAHGMQVRSFGLLLAGPLPIGAFAEPEGRELMAASKRERLRLYAAGPAVNIVTSFIAFILIAMVASQFVAINPGAHASGIVVDGPAEIAGLEAYENIVAANGQPIADAAALSTFLSAHEANETIVLDIRGRPSEGGQSRQIEVTLADRYGYEIARGTDPALLDAVGIEEGDGFLGVIGLTDATIGVDRLAGPLGGEKTYSQRIFGLIIQPLSMLSIPLDFDGHVMHTEEEALITIDANSPIAFLGGGGGVVLLEGLFWMIWINMLLGFANLVPMIPFDGGHMMTDLVHSVTEKLNRRFGNWHPVRVERFARTISGYSSLLVLIIFALPVLISFFA
jgi:membrane-associated protease RseP (regulator of RpoE activity)